MIRLIDTISELEDCDFPPDVAIVRIFAAVYAYGISCPFLLTWKQYDNGGNVTAILSQLDSSMTVWLSESADLDELTQFIQMVGCSEVFCCSDVLDGRLVVKNSGIVMHADDVAPMPVYDVEHLTNPSPAVLYPILESGFGQAALPPFEAWYADFSHRQRHGFACSVLVKYGGVPVSCACAVMSHTAALIYGLATISHKQKNGFGGQTLDLILANLQQTGFTNIFVCVENSSLESFYQKHGFKRTSLFRTYKIPT